MYSHTVSSDAFVHEIGPAGSVDGDPASVLGGKGASIVELRETGFPVPDGFVLATEAYQSFVRQAGIASDLAVAVEFDTPDPDPDALAEAGREARELIREAPLPPEHVTAVTEAYAAMGKPRVAVRSSATDEDGADASFAGQQETYLAVEGTEAVLQRVTDCWASLFTDRALSYRTEHDRADEAGIAVVVQELVEADKSGVLFTVDPATGADEMTVEAAWGLGEAVVSGDVSPDNYVVDRDTGRLLEETVNTKRVMIERAPDGETVQRPVPEGKREAQVLDRDELRRLVDIGREIEARRDGPQDIEWAISDGEVIVLQARPITTGDGATPTGTEADDSSGVTVDGLGAAPGSAVGEIRFETLTAVKRAKEGHDVVLARKQTAPSDVPGMKAAEAVVTAEGGTTSHAAIVARELGTPAVVGCEDLDIDEDVEHAEFGGRTVDPGTRVHVDGTDGEVTLVE